MDAGKEQQPATKAERKSDRELVVTRTFNGPRHLVFEAWSKPDLFQRWWMPKSCGIPFLSCEMDVRTGGSYRLVFGHPETGQPFTFFGRYIEVIAPSRIVWTNEEAGEGGAVTTVTFEEKGGRTLVTMHDLHPSKEALDEHMESGACSGTNEQFDQLEEIVGTLKAA